MNRIVDDLLLLAAADRPDFLTWGEVDLTDLVVGALARVSALAPRRWEVVATADAVAIADGQRLTQALVQLAANAIRFTGESDRLTMASRLRGDEVVLTVSDTGAGVADELKPVVFDRFARGARRTDEGAGLGLAIVRTIATAHGGDVGVEDTPGGGATFTITFPHRRPQAHPTGAERRVPHSQPADPTVFAAGGRAR